MRHRDALFLVSIAVVGATALAQQAPTFRTTVEIVQLQVSVADSKGRFVPGLQPEDFELLLDGAARPVHTVYEVDLPAPASSDRAPLVAVPAAASPVSESEYTRLPVSVRRHFLLLFDLRFTDFNGARLARDAAVRFVDEQLHPSDLVALAIIGVRGVELVQPFIADHARISRSVAAIRNRFASEQVAPSGDAIRDLLGEVGGAAGPDGVDAVGEALMMAGSMEAAAYEAAVDAYLIQLRALAQMLHAVRGRKHVVMFTTGFSDAALFGSLGDNAFDRGDSESLAGELYGAGRVFRAVDALLYTVNTERVRGFAANDPSVFRANPTQCVGTGCEQMGEANTGMTGRSTLVSGSANNRGSLAGLAEVSGGEWFINLTDFDKPLRRIEEASRSYYVVTYRRAAEDPPAVAVQVRVRDGRAKTVTAPEWVAPPPPYAAMTPGQRALQLAEVLAEPLYGAGGIELSMFPVPGGAAGVARFAAHVPAMELDRLASERGDGSVEIELGAFTLQGSRIGDAVSRGVGKESLTDGQGVLFSDVLQAPDSGELRVLVRELRVGEPRHLRQEFRVSSSDRRDARLLGPVLVGAYPTADGFTPLLQAGQTAELWLAGADLGAGSETGAVEIAALLDLEDATGNRFRLPATLTRTRNDGGYEERWLRTVVPPETEAGEATLTLWMRAGGSEQIFSRALTVRVEEAS